MGAQAQARRAAIACQGRCMEEGREGGGGSLSLVMRLAVAWQSHDGTRSALPGNIDVVGYH